MVAQKTETILEYRTRIIFFMKNTVNTNFSYLGTRNYINSTSIIEFIHDSMGIFIDDLYIGGCDDLYALDSAGKLDELLK